MPGWRNGRRCGLKIRCPKGRAGSTPALGTTLNLHYYNNLPRPRCYTRDEGLDLSCSSFKFDYLPPRFGQLINGLLQHDARCTSVDCRDTCLEWPRRSLMSYS